MKILLLLVMAASMVMADHKGQDPVMPPCRFAKLYQPSDMLNETTQKLFVRSVMLWEARFISWAVDPRLGVTSDGLNLDYFSGTPSGSRRPFSASSKEALHLNMLTFAVAQDDQAIVDVPGLTRAEALNTLRKKLKTYNDFDAKYPGYGGFLPWYHLNADGITPQDGWWGRTPSLDNGQLAWSIKAVVVALKVVGETELAQGYDDWASKMARNAIRVFWAGQGRVRTVTVIKDITLPPEQNEYSGEGEGYLDDPYEGELMTWFMDLFGNWSDLPQGSRDAVWEFKRAKFQSVNLRTQTGNDITVQRGYWFSAHEQWKYLILPYNMVPLAARVQRQSELARTWYAVEHGFPGLFASVGVPSTPDVQPPTFGYVSDTGIPEIASQPVSRQDIITPYAAFPLILVNKPYGLAWYLNMIQGGAMQGPLGSTESSFVNGTGICPLTTFDSKITTVVSILGGVGRFNAMVLKEKPWMLERFMTVVKREHDIAFKNGILGEELPELLPHKSVPLKVTDFSTCPMSD